DGHAYRGDFEKTSEALQTAVPLTNDLELVDGALALTEIATFFLPTGANDFGQQLLNAAIQMLNDHPTKSGPDYVDTVKRLALVLDDYAERRNLVIALATPVVDQAEEWSAQRPEFGHIW